MVQKVVKDGKVAILVSPGYGAGWSTWMSTYGERAMFCPAIVNALLDHIPYEDLEKLAEKEFPDAYLGGLRQLKVEWLPEGERFYIREYDGSERLCTSGDLSFTA